MEGEYLEGQQTGEITKKSFSKLKSVDIYIQRKVFKMPLHLENFILSH
jgi:hypothetical protein